MERGATVETRFSLRCAGRDECRGEAQIDPVDRPHVRNPAVRLVDAALGGLDPQLRRPDRKLGERAVERQSERPGSLDRPRQFQHVLNVAERRRSDVEPSGERQPADVLCQPSIQTGFDALEGQLQRDVVVALRSGGRGEVRNLPGKRERLSVQAPFRLD